MCAFLRHPAILNDSNKVRILDGGQAVGDDDTGAALSGVIKCLLNDLFGQRGMFAFAVGQHQAGNNVHNTFLFL